MTAKESFIQVTAGEITGRIDATVTGPDLAIDYLVDNNGRGAKLHEAIRLDADGVPSDWKVDGTSMMGAAVTESLTSTADTRSWHNLSEHNKAPTAPSRVYVPSDTSPYTSGIIARAALAAGGSIDALPAGRIRAEYLHTTTIADREAEVYQLAGVGLVPEFVLLDREQRLLARLGGELALNTVTVRQENASQAGELSVLEAELIHEQVRRIAEHTRHRYDQPVRIRHARLFDPHNLALTARQCVVIHRGRITSVEPEPITATERLVEIDAAGGTLMAGLHDMHAHASPWTELFHLAAGVTTVRDMGNDNALMLALIDHLAAGELVGPSIVPSGLIEGRSPYSARVGGIIPGTLDAGLAAVQWYAARGYHQIKIYNSMNPDWVTPLAAEAHRLGLRVAGHIPAFATPDRMIEDGYDEITHINQLVLGWLLNPDEDTRTALRLSALVRAKDLDLSSSRVQRTVDLMRARNIGLDTTTVILERLMLSRAGTVQPGDTHYLGHMPIGYQRYRRRTLAPARDEPGLRDYDQAFPKLLEVIALLHDAGIPLWPGTDDGTGFTVHRELELYVAAGVPAAEVLRMATLDCAAHLDRDHSHGSVERGKRADLILVAGDPTHDISAVRNIGAVIKGCDIFYPAELYKELHIEPFTTPPPVTDLSHR